MLIKNHLHKFLRFKLRFLRPQIIRYLQAQLFISLCAWPFLAAWGLPLTPVSLIGNALFAPFLTCFLFLSSLLFFCELASLPTAPFIYLLEIVTSAWHWLLHQSDRSWLFICGHPPLGVTFALPFLALIILHLKKLTPYLRISLLLSLYLFAGAIIPLIQSSSDAIFTLPYYSQELTLTRSNRKTTLIDPGIIGRSLSAPKKVSTVLIPFLIKKGIKHLDSVIISKPSVMVFKAVAQLIKSFPVKAIYLPAWHGTLKNNGWAAWEAVLKQARKHSTTIELIKGHCTIDCGSYGIEIKPETKKSRKNRLVYHMLRSCIHRNEKDKAAKNL